MDAEIKAPLRLAVAQFDAVPGDLSHNIARHIELLEEAASEAAALAVFPELSVTGYCSSLLDEDVAACAVDPAGSVLSELRAACNRLNVAAVVGAPVQEEGGYYLSSIVIGRAGAIESIYAKMYVHADERNWFTAGSEPKLVELDGWKLGMGICYDSSFPEHARAYARAGADVYVLPGAFPLGSSDYRRTIYFPARSLENTIYLAFSNYVGSHDGLDYGGMSAIHGPDGQCLADAGTTDTGLAVHDLDHGQLLKTRQTLQMLKDCG